MMESIPELPVVNTQAFETYIGCNQLRAALIGHSFANWRDVFNHTYKVALKCKTDNPQAATAVIVRMFEWIIINVH